YLRPEARQRPSGSERSDHARDGGDRLARADLMTAMLQIAERCEVGMIASPIESIADRRDGAKHEESGADAVHLGEQRILQGPRDRTRDDERPQPKTSCEHQHARADREASEKDEREGGEYRGRRHAGFQQENCKESSAATEGERMDGIVQVEEVDRV